jgi:hypothetical protein
MGEPPVSTEVVRAVHETSIYDLEVKDPLAKPVT